jgi:CheY-specific phosphatase CheX
VRADIVNPFLQAASQVLESELGSKPTRGQVGLQRTPYRTDEVTAVVAVTGEVAGADRDGLGDGTGHSGAHDRRRVPGAD